jgi:lysyl-tRNA synthetase, class II
MASENEIREVRLKKLEILKSKGINPYPARVPRDMSLGDFKAKFEEYEASKKEVSLAGRIMAIRGQGAILFVVLFDGTENTQVILKKDEIEESIFTLFSDTVDIGDFISVTGTAMTSKTGEKSLLLNSWVMASKSLLPLPEKFHGLQDVDERYRKRYLDFLMNDELRDLMVKKSKFWEVTREFLKKEGFLEVETPTLEVTTGGAEAEPFKTHHNDFDLDVFLRISVGELWQKRLMAGGFPKTFEIGRVYRNEGTSPEHAQEFTSMEFYASFMDYTEGIVFTENLIKTVVQRTFGKMDFETRGHKFSLEGSWPKISYIDIVKEKTGINVLEATLEEMEEKLKELGVKYDGKNKERLTDTLWKFCRKQISGPVWLIDVPKLVSPLSKAKVDNPLITERVQLILAGSEMTNGFSELNDPIDQKERFEVQKKLIEGGDTEAMMPDHEFVEMLEYGMPPTFGFAYGDRLFAFLADKPLRDLQTFPLVRPKEEDSKKNKEVQVAIAVVNTSVGLESWQVANTIAHLSMAFGARSKNNLFKFDSVETEDGEKIKLNIQHAIILKEGSTGDILNLIKESKKEGLEISEFTREMLETTNDSKIKEKTKQKKHKDIEFLGALVFGAKSKIEELSKNLKLIS